MDYFNTTFSIMREVMNGETSHCLGSLLLDNRDVCYSSSSVHSVHCCFKMSPGATDLRTRILIL